jgi:hypothetical protein
MGKAHADELALKAKSEIRTDTSMSKNKKYKCTPHFKEKYLAFLGRDIAF